MDGEIPPPGPGIYLLATPIGNLEDVSLRSLRILGAADVLACEDTRVTRRLFLRHGLPPPGILLSCNDHNEGKVAPRLAALAREGKVVVCCTDAGMPGISDPGHRVALEAIRAGVEFTVVPGPSAATAAVSLSGLAAASFTFFGFPPRRDGRLKEIFRRHGGLRPALVFYESPRRLVRLLTLAAAGLGGERRAAVCLELTKKFERVARGSLAELGRRFGEGETRGEAVVIIEGRREERDGSEAAGEDEGLQ
ncbi:MAG: rRNA small subunit methyltransferase 1 [Planctomycetota bacterium]|jgi:16S rRNA (cytidine1402-2'-O)-methyltransferase|nr:rRNA small subunit methyltransferase 1 [Planctomycetota bacterium]